MEIYIDKAFLDSFFSKYNPENDCHRNLRKLLKDASMGKVYLSFDYADKDEFIEAIESNTLLDELINTKSVVTDSSFTTKYQFADFYERGSASKYFFVEEMDIAIIEQDFGCMAFNMRTLEKAAFLFSWLEMPINKKKNHPQDWSFITKFKHPMNALVITDNYLFDYSNEEMNQNLVPLLLNIMPVQLKIPFHLTIIGKDAKKAIDIDKKKQQIEEILNNVFNYPILLTIIPLSFHDRHIFTNYLWVRSGIGFSIFRIDKGKLKLKNDSILTILPISYMGTNFTSYSLSEQFSGGFTLPMRNAQLKECKRCNDIESMSVGDKINRLLL